MPLWGDSTVRSLAVTLVVLGGLIVVHELVTIWRLPERSRVRRWAALVMVWWSAAVGLLVRGIVVADAAPSAESASVDNVVSATLASSVLSHVLTRRRQQIRERQVPDRLTIEEARAMAVLARAAGETAPSGKMNLDDSHPTVGIVLDAVNRVARPDVDRTPPVLMEWSALLRVYGTPRVETSTGTEIKYHKSRALELTAWLAFNRDRRSRSAARTAIWDIEISDATFSTVVSDLRRALSTIDPDVSPTDWVPTTYTDEIIMSDRLITDADLLRDALELFRVEPSVDAHLYEVLAMVRDVPFAGTRWSWADLDGTTTRLVILAVDASIEAARYAADSQRPDLLDIAATAGLRVMPGCPELVAIQQSYLSRVSMSR